MKAICVNPNRELEVRDVPAADDPPRDHVLVEMDSSAINHGDKTFLRRSDLTGVALAGSRYAVWGASCAGKVLAIGPGVPSDFSGRKVTIYRSLTRSEETIGLWCEREIVPYTSCSILPDSARAPDYCGSPVNAMTGYAFLDEIAAEGHRAVIATAGNSATGQALAALARRRATPFIALVRSAATRDALAALGVEYVLATSDAAFESAFGALAAELHATAVFDGVGGGLVTRLAPLLPMNSRIYVYGFLDAAAPMTFPSVLLMTNNLTLKRFSNFESATVRSPERRIAALNALDDRIDDPMFRTRIGREFRFDQISEAMAYECAPGAKAVLVP